MSGAPEAKNDFKFILNSVRSEALQAVAQELTDLFPLDLPNAVNIAKSAPIILIDKLSPRQARSVGTYAIRLKALGADVQVTGQPVGKLQVLRWPLLPDIAKRPGHHLICPNCGARLQVQVHVRAEAAAAAPQPEPGPAEQPPEVMLPPAEEPPDVMPQPAPEMAAQAAPPPPQAPPPPPAPPAPEPEPAEEVVLEPVGEDLVELTDDEVVLEDEPVELEPAASSEPGEPVGGGGTCRVTLVGKIRGKKKSDAAELIAYYQGITQDEALAQLSKTVVTVAKDLTEEQAATCKNQFSEIGVKVKVRG